MMCENWQISVRDMLLDHVKKLGYDINHSVVNLSGFIIIFGSNSWSLYRPGNVLQSEWSIVDIYTEFYDQLTGYTNIDAALNNPGQFVIQENNKIINDILDKLD